jgi:type II secretory ATPase GspE/PulE/Tfp pilus assembly ATPase PilB-like protein
MSDHSHPPIDLLPAAAGFVWPNPEGSAQGRAAAGPSADHAGGEPCEIEGLGGQRMVGHMQRFDPHSRKLQFRIGAASRFQPVSFDQFRRLRLTRPQPQAEAEASSGVEQLIQRPVLPFRVQYGDGTVWEGLTVGHRHEPCGWFLFEPLGEGRAVRRSFVPASAVSQVEVGMRLGEALIDQQAATPEQVAQALREQQRLRERKLGDIMVVQQIITPEELNLAIERQARMPMVRIGEALTGLGLVTEEQLLKALQLQRQDRSLPLGELLVNQGLVTRTDLQTALARKMGYPLVDVTGFPVDVAALQKLPYAVARRIPALPLLLRGGKLVLAMEDPSRRRAVGEAEFACQLKVVPVLARTGQLQAALEAAYQKLGGGSSQARGSSQASDVDAEAEDASQLLASMEATGDSSFMPTEDLDEAHALKQSDNSLVRLINTMIQEAQNQGVSDIHIECRPGRERVAIRFRRDGLLRPYLELPHTYRHALIARLKIMCDLDISERRKPQDGKISFGRYVQGSRLELRLATIPTHSHCEDAVLRLLASSKPIPLDRLGLSAHNLAQLKAAAERPYGMLLCVGPTGSGKTTTLHSVLSHINTPERKIWTAEDPIEITQAGLRQVQVNPKIGWTFAKALRAFLRADPDVVMVGEIRDGETAQVAVEASLTGHLVLSTLHTNSAPETVTRLLDMGMDPFNFADALLGVLAQRLVRRLCPKCVRSRPASAAEEKELLDDYLHAMQGLQPLPDRDAVLADWRQRFGQPPAVAERAAEGAGDAADEAAPRLQRYEPVGCEHCGGTGFRGRAGIHELMQVSPKLRQRVQAGTRADELRLVALEEGMRTLRQDGIEKVLAGVTTIEEVRASS